MVRKKSNQRITKIKYDIISDLIDKAEKIPVEDAVTINPAGADLTPYPDLNKIRFWIRDYLLKGINGVYFTHSYLNYLKSYKTIDKERFLGSTNYLSTIIDGLILNTQQHKTVLNKVTNKEEFAPKPGLQLSNLLVTFNTTSNDKVNTAFPISYRTTYANSTLNYYDTYTRQLIGVTIPNYLISYIPTYSIWNSFPNQESYKFIAYQQFNSFSRSFIKESCYVTEYQGVGLGFPRTEGAVNPPDEDDYYAWNYKYDGYVSSYQSVCTYSKYLEDKETNKYYIPYYYYDDDIDSNSVSKTRPTWWTNIYPSPKTMNCSTGSEIWTTMAISRFGSPNINYRYKRYIWPQ